MLMKISVTRLSFIPICLAKSTIGIARARAGISRTTRIEKSRVYLPSEVQSCDGIGGIGPKNDTEERDTEGNDSTVEERAEIYSRLIGRTNTVRRNLCLIEKSTHEDLLVACQANRIGQPNRRNFDELPFELQAGADEPDERTDKDQQEKRRRKIKEDIASEVFTLHCFSPRSRKA